MISRKLFLSLILATLLMASSLVVSIPALRPVSAQQAPAGPIPSGSKAESNWEYLNHDSWSSNYAPQTQINKDNAQYLELKWIFPFPPASEYAKNQPGGVVSQGAITPPLVVDGVVYLSDNMRNIYAFDASTGKLNWLNQWMFDWNQAIKEQPSLRAGSGHIHGANYVNGQLFTSNNGCAITAIDAVTGKTKFEVQNICKDIDGNLYDWPLYKGPGKCGLNSHPGSVYRKDNVLVVAFCGADGPWGGRSFVDGYDLTQNPPKRVWRTYMEAPAQGDPEWAIKACNNAKAGWYFSYKAFYREGKLGINCKDVPRENVINDWGVPKHYTTAISAQWGQMAMDEETGLVYFGTGNQGGWANQTFTPGPNLYAATLVAMEAKTGKIVWWYQHVPRDMVEGDSSWNTMLAKLSIRGVERKVVIKFTTVGLVWVNDAATGEPLWIFEAPFLKSRVDQDGAVRGRSACSPKPGADPSTQDGFWNDPMSKYDMQEKKWINYPLTSPACLNPIRPGESDFALDPSRNTLYVAIGQGWNWDVFQAKPHGTIGISPSVRDTFVRVPRNTTIFAVDASTGKEKWSYFINGVSFRGGVIVSGGVVYIPAADGSLYLLDADSGKLLHKRFFGTSLVIQPTIGKDANGKSILLLLNGRARTGIGGLAEGGDIPGALMAFGLPDKIPQPADVAREALKQVPKEQLKDVLKDVPKEALSQAAPTAETISPISYGIVGVGIVLIVVSGILFTRRKKT